MQSRGRGTRSLAAGVQRDVGSQQRVAAYVIRGEAAFLLFTCVCVALHPGFVLKWREGGLSNYGLHIKTAVPYTLALALLSLYSQRAAAHCASGDSRSRQLRWLLAAFSLVLLLVLLSSYVYSLNPTLKVVHFALGGVLVVLVGAASVWMFVHWSPSTWDWLFLAVQLVGDAVALLTGLGDAHLLFLSEMLTNIGFVGLLVRSSRRVAVHGNGGPYSGEAAR